MVRRIHHFATVFREKIRKIFPKESKRTDSPKFDVEDPLKDSEQTESLKFDVEDPELQRRLRGYLETDDPSEFLQYFNSVDLSSFNSRMVERTSSNHTETHDDDISVLGDNGQDKPFTFLARVLSEQVFDGDLIAPLNSDLNTQDVLGQTSNGLRTYDDITSAQQLELYEFLTGDFENLAQAQALLGSDWRMNLSGVIKRIELRRKEDRELAFRPPDMYESEQKRDGDGSTLRKYHQTLCEEYARWSKGHTNTYDDLLRVDDYRQCTTSTSIYSYDNKTEREALEVPLQKIFTGPIYVLSSKDADTPLTVLGMDGILDEMNKKLETNCELSPDMKRLLQFSLAEFVDFGQAYALLRPRWHMDPREALENINARYQEDKDRRSRALQGDIIVDPYYPPRRLWDLWSNRVVPYWVVQVAQFDPFKKRLDWIAVSHSWMDAARRHTVKTPINGNEWPVPVPVDTTLDRIRVELLNLASMAGEEDEAEVTEAKAVTSGARRAENEERRLNSKVAARWSRAQKDRLKARGVKPHINLVWLDILCLRQEGEQTKEELRADEWRLDVPTIGPIYWAARWTVYYFSGLGRPFEVAKDKDDPRHWMNRAWTLQETKKRVIVAGRASTSPNIPHIAKLTDRSVNQEDEWSGSMKSMDGVTKSLMTTFTESTSIGIWPAISLMQHRKATNELDKVAGLIFRLTNEFCPPVPIYIVGEDPEDAWLRLIKVTRRGHRVSLFFHYPGPGQGKEERKLLWCPSWRQLMDMVVFPVVKVHNDAKKPIIDFDKGSGSYKINCYYAENCSVHGLSKVSRAEKSSSREGYVLVVDKRGVEHKLAIKAEHEMKIDDRETYVLVAYFGKQDNWDYSGYPNSEWVVARQTHQGVLEKVSIILFEGRDANKTICNIAASNGISSFRLL